MSIDNWLKVTRPDDGETVGYLAPLAADYSLLQPRTLLGHALGTATDFLDGEERLAAHGISELAERWQLQDAPPLSCVPVSVSLRFHPTALWWPRPSWSRP
ncbi:hypothetical protein ART_0770 [Arthrobacter sp. PAMC 25486]|uniref:hypothetical protein n=1 Tax=Arthrobacter sp. PAMC 25486 TaxID=1494608 RepID=UPI000535AF14|nr:hypothetical protein [Arthrobacter sp. PAMC 25486]AIY00369.1 hypothetical protein ART_0770 [Arthrobacter sp. PAMC 25486]